jgi:hypothetical protein
MSETPSEEETAKWHRRLGGAANNRGWKLAEMPVRTAAEDEEMLHAAHASRHLWSKVGNEMNFALGDMLLGQVHALLGHGPLAMRYAEAAFAFFSSRESEAWETAFSHLVLSHAAHAAGKPDMHHAHYRSALEAANALTEAEDREIFDASLRVVPKPDAP